MPPRVVHVVPHTHWDREWYEPFERTRVRLLRVLDAVVETLAAEPSFRFTLDGQTAAIEDYLAVRPEAEPAVAAAVRDGRLLIGPWRILMDSFLVSGETIVRNLQQADETARRLGAAMPMGYLPDPFGHCAQLPQVLRLAGIDSACVWRGVPRAVDRLAFRWEGPDGSTVDTLYLPYGYGHAARLPTDLDELIARARRLAADLEPFGDGAVLPAPNGNDHAPPQHDLARALSAANDAQEEFRFRIGTLPELLAALDGERPTWRGELRSGARANLLPGVTSARIRLKQAEVRATTMLERYAEPLVAISGTDAGLLLDRAWRFIVVNAGHDSITGCGSDDVARAVEARYQDATGIADAVAHDALASLATEEGILVWNPSPRARTGAVEVTVAAPGDPRRLVFTVPDGGTAPAQPIEVTDQVALDLDLTGEQLGSIVPWVASRKLADLFVNDLRIERRGRSTSVRLAMGATPEGHFDVEGAKRRVEELARARPRGRFRVLGTGPPLVRTLVQLHEVPPLGWTTIRPAVGAPGAALAADETWIDNGLLRVAVASDGTLSITDARSGATFEGALGLEDGGDAGDLYNYAPPPADRVVTDPEEPPTVTLAHHGPVEAALRIERRYAVPAGLRADSRGRARRRVSLPVVSTVALRRDEPFLRVTIDLDNRADDHRLRVLFPLPFTAARSVAGDAFAMVERGLDAEGGPHEAGMPTFPSRGWVAGSDGTTGLAVLHHGTPEYELVDGTSLAVTLLRCVGVLSRHGTATRAGPAGPAVATPQAQVPGPHRFELALAPFAGDPMTAGIGNLWERFALPLRAASSGSGDRPAIAAPLSIEPATVHLTALTRDGDVTTCRLVNLSAAPTDAVVRFADPLLPRAASLIGLLGAQRGAVPVRDGLVRLPLRPWEIATLRLT